MSDLMTAAYAAGRFDEVNSAELAQEKAIDDVCEAVRAMDKKEAAR